MAISDINRGTNPNDGTGTTLRAGGTIINLILDMWNTVSGGIAYSAGKVGIGTGVTSPNTEIEIVGTPTATGLDTFGKIQSSRVNGTLELPTPILSGDVIGLFAFEGQYDTTKGHRTISSYIAAIAEANYTDTEIKKTKMIVNVTDTAGASYTTAEFLGDGGVLMHGLKSGANQGAAGAITDEIWIDTADQSLKLGV